MAAIDKDLNGQFRGATPVTPDRKMSNVRQNYKVIQLAFPKEA